LPYALTSIPIITLIIDGNPLPTSAQSGLYLDPQSGAEIERDESGIPLDTEGKQLPKDNQGHFIYSSPRKPDEALQQTTEMGTVVAESAEDRGPAVTSSTASTPIIYPVVGGDGQLLPTDSSGRFVDTETGERIPTDQYGIPTDDSGRILPMNGEGAYVREKIQTTHRPTTTTTSTRPPIVIIGPEGHPLPTNNEGLVVSNEGRPYQVDEYGRPLGPDSSPLPTNAQGKHEMPKSHS